MIVLGIDPGLICTGFGVVKKNNNSIILIDYGYLKMSSSQSLPERIALFFDFFNKKIIHHKITDIALETPFLGKNAQNFLKLGYLRGIVYLLVQQHVISISEFAPRQVKQAITGWGAASKEQVARVVLQLFPKLNEPKYNDVTDALAITLCGLWSQKQNS